MLQHTGEGGISKNVLQATIVVVIVVVIAETSFGPLQARNSTRLDDKCRQGKILAMDKLQSEPGPWPGQQSQSQTLVATTTTTTEKKGLPSTSMIDFMAKLISISECLCSFFFTIVRFRFQVKTVSLVAWGLANWQELWHYPYLECSIWSIGDLGDPSWGLSFNCQKRIIKPTDIEPNPRESDKVNRLFFWQQAWPIVQAAEKHLIKKHEIACQMKEKLRENKSRAMRRPQKKSKMLSQVIIEPDDDTNCGYYESVRNISQEKTEWNWGKEQIQREREKRREKVSERYV